MRRVRAIAALLAGIMTAGVAGCGPTVSSQAGNPAPPPGAPAPPAQRQGMTTKQKVVLLAGAAALYYLYKKHQNAKGAGREGQYYRSKNGGVYYRDPKNPKIVHWVTPPTEQRPLQVPMDEFQRATGSAPPGYNGGVISTAPPGWQ